MFLSKLNGWIDKYLNNVDRKEINLVLKIRAIGLLGWDILYHQSEYICGYVKEKKELLREIIIS